jgi:hypothetical protein
VTPAEDEEEQRRQLARELAQHLPADSEWDLLTTMLWIGSRDLKWTASKIVEARTVLHPSFVDLAATAHGVVLWSLNCLRQRSETTLYDLLEPFFHQLIAGDVRASGLELGVGPRAPIPRAQWLVLRFPANAPEEHDGLCCAYNGDGQPDNNTHFWSWLLFDRSSVMTAFPEHSRDWLPGDVKAEDWAASTAADAEARRRAPGANPIEAEICRKLSEMWNEARAILLKPTTFARYRRDARARKHAAQASGSKSGSGADSDRI